MFGIFPHSIDKQATGRGYVARTLDADYRNYGGLVPLKTYKQRTAADNYASKLSAKYDGLVKVAA